VVVGKGQQWLGGVRRGTELVWGNVESVIGSTDWFLQGWVGWTKPEGARMHLIGWTEDSNLELCAIS
jgi:hypothetical protein